MSQRVFVTMGSNMEPERHLPLAAQFLSEQTTVLGYSAVYASTPTGPDGEPLDQPGYLNAAALLEVPDDVMPDMFKYRVLNAIEVALGRVRSADRYAPRTIDLDIALFGDFVTDAPVTLPDPEILTRAHVALPLADLAPNAIHPVTGETLAEIAARFGGEAGIRRTEIILP